MSRNSGGTYSLATGNPVVTGTVISSTWGNNTLSDIATALTDSLSRTGLGGMSSALQLTNGAIGTPSLTFAAETTLGWYRASASNLRLVMAGVDRETWTATALTIAASNVTIGAPAAGAVLTTTGNVVLNAPASGTSLQIGAATTNVALTAGVFGSTNNPRLQVTSTEATFLTNLDFTGSVTPIGRISIGGTSCIDITNGRNITVAAPSSGNTLTLNNVSFSRALVSTDGTVTTQLLSNAITAYFGTQSAHPLILRTGDLDRITIAAAGNVTINAPSSGTTATINTVNAGTAFLLTDGGVQARWDFVGGSSNFGSNTSHIVNILTGNTARVSIGTSGNVTINAPTAGVALTVAAFSGTHSTKIADSANAAFNAGYLELPVNGQATPYTAVLADAGKSLYYSAAGAATFTIPANGSVAYPTGTTLTFVNDASGATNMTIAITTDTLIFSPGGTAGSRTLAQFGRATAHKVTATRWIISGSGLS